MHQEGTWFTGPVEKEKASLCPEGNVLQKTHHQLDDVNSDDN